MTDAEFQSVVLRSWVGHLIGVVINTPLLLLVASRPELLRRLRRRPSPEVMAQFCTLMVSLWVVFSFKTIDSYKLFYLLFFPLIWIATRHAIVGAVLGISLIQCGLIVAVAYIDIHHGMAVTEFQFIMLALAVTGLFLGMAGTESRNASKALDKSESQLRVIVATAPDGIFMVDVHGVVVAANPAASRIFGYATSGLVGVCVHDFLPDYRRALQAGVVTEGVAIRHDGSQFPVELAVGKAGSDGAELSITIARDISRRRKLERKFGEQQVELARSARLAAAGEMAAALAHELHQPLAAIRNYVQVAQMLATTADTQELMGKVEREAVRAADVVRRLRDFFRRGVSQLECISVQQLIGGALAPMQEEVARQQ